MNFKSSLIFLSTILLYSVSLSLYGQTGKPKNIILFIGDGMGVTQWYSGITVKKEKLTIEKFDNIGFIKTYSLSNYSADGASAGTAMASGIKTYNGAVGLGIDTLPVKTIFDYARDKNFSTGIVTANTLMEGSISPFVAHEKTRMNMENIAAAYVKDDVDVFIGGGSKYFKERKDKRNLIDELRQKGYQVVNSWDSICNIKKGKLAGFTSEENNPALSEGRGPLLTKMVNTALNILSQNKNGFILVVEDSFIDRASHLGIGELVALETIDFDNAIGKAYEFAVKDGNTVIIVTSGQEASGMSIADGSMKDGTVKPKWTEPGMLHTGVMVPVFAFGNGSEIFRGIQENTDIFNNMMKLMKLNLK